MNKTVFLMVIVVGLLVGCSSNQIDNILKTGVSKYTNEIDKSIKDGKPIDKSDSMEIKLVVDEYKEAYKDNKTELNVVNKFDEYYQQCDTSSGIEKIDIKNCLDMKSVINKLLK